MSTLSHRFLSCFIIGFFSQINAHCLNDLCFHYDRTEHTWLNAYDRCSHRTLVQLSNEDQRKLLEKINIDQKSLIWLGANNFATDRQWRWLDGTLLNPSIVDWCPNDDQFTSVPSIQCIAYNLTAHCLLSQTCETFLPAPCIEINHHNQPLVERSIRTRRQVSSGRCTNAFTGSYSYWWTYSMLLLNWFILFSFVNHLTGRLIDNKRTGFLIFGIVFVAFVMIIAVSVLWGVQSNNLILIPVILVSIACNASLLLVICILILTANRTKVILWKRCMIITIIVLIIDMSLTIGVVLCIAHCSSYITMVSSALDQDLIAAILAGLMSSMSVLLNNAILMFLGHRSNNAQPGETITGQVPINRSAPSATTTNRMISIRRIERSTSPVDNRVLNQFYADQPKDVHFYQLDGRQYRVYEGQTLTELDHLREELNEAMSSRERRTIRLAIQRARSSVYASALSEELREAQNLADSLG